MIVFTSGTTGLSKGVCLTQSNLYYDVFATKLLVGEQTLNSNDRVVVILPLHHMFGVTTTILLPVLAYRCVVAFGDGVGNLFNDLVTFRPKLMFVVPMIVEGLYKNLKLQTEKNNKKQPEFYKYINEDLSIIISGGAPLNDEIVDFFDAYNVEVLNGYGITECSPVISCNPVHKKKKSTVGVLPPKEYCDVKIMDNEILVKGKIVMPEYYKDEQATRDAFQDGWFKTGDLGYIHKEGYLHITGRKKNIIVLKDGNNISPEELESLINSNPLVDSFVVYVEKVGRATVLSVAINLDYIFIEKNKIQNVESKINEFIDKVNEQLPNYKRISNFNILKDSFKRTSLGKINSNIYLTLYGG